MLTLYSNFLERVTGWIKNAIFILIVYYLFFSSGSTGAALKHSMTINRNFPHEVTTPKLGLKIYVNDYYIDMIKKNQNAVYQVIKEIYLTYIVSRETRKSSIYSDIIRM
jgi:hypothetical protein